MVERFRNDPNDPASGIASGAVEKDRAEHGTIASGVEEKERAEGRLDPFDRVRPSQASAAVVNRMLMEGAVVHYVLNDGLSKGECRPALIVRNPMAPFRLGTRPQGSPPVALGTVNLAVFLDGANDNGAFPEEPAARLMWVSAIPQVIEFATDIALRSYAIDVDEKDAVITLHGDVPNEDVRLAFERRARTVPGVRQVVNQLRLNPAMPEAAERDRDTTLGSLADRPPQPGRSLESRVRTAFFNREPPLGSTWHFAGDCPHYDLAGSGALLSERDTAANEREAVSRS